MRNLRSRTAALALALGLGTSGCASLGTMGNLGTLGEVLGGVIGGAGGMGGAQQGQLSAEVQHVDAQRQLIQLRTEDGRTGAVPYDSRTVVVYRQQQYPVTALEGGDWVNVTVEQVGQNDVIARRIDVVQSVQERGGAGSVGGTAGVQQLAGRVGQIDYDRGIFVLQTQYSGTVTVSLPYNPPSGTVQRFRQLRTGDSVGIEGVQIGTSRVELHRFL